MEELLLNQPSPKEKRKSPPQPVVAAPPERRVPFPLRDLGFFVLRRLASLLLVVIVIVFICHLCLNFGQLNSPTFFVRAVVVPEVPPTFWEVLGQSLTDTGHYLGQLLRGSLGNQVGVPAIPVGETLRRVYGRSMLLLGLALLLGAALGILSGIYSARRRHRLVAALASTVANLGTTTPSFFLAVFLQATVLALGWHFLPVGGMGNSPREAVRSLVLPVIVLAVRPFAYMTQVTHTALAEAFDSDYARTARAKGLAWRTVLRRHAVPNVLIPILSMLGNTLRFSLSSLPVVEVLFGRDGLGRMLVLALQRCDPPLTTGLVLAMAVTFLTISLVLDILYRFLDPRLREVPL